MFENLPFDNLVLRSLPVTEKDPQYIGEVQGACFSRVKPAPLQNPKLVALSSEALALVKIHLTHQQLEEDPELKKAVEQYFSGNSLLPGSSPAAHCYCGYQFGYFSGQLGDGAAMYLGEIVNDQKERWEIQFKGAGKTPFSRGADGRKVLRSSLREFLCSEACYYLGIPTNRAGTLVTSDTRIDRDPFYSGKVIYERCSVITRIAPTFLRFGSFEIFKGVDKMTGRAGPSKESEKVMLPQMLDYLVKNFFPEYFPPSLSPSQLKTSYEACNLHIVSSPPPPSIQSLHQNDQILFNQPSSPTSTTPLPVTNLREAECLAVYSEIVRRTAHLVSLWQCFGFCHGVLNTDNMSILGLTIDYGPFAFMEAFDPKYICNGSDHDGRYCYEAQVEICQWNCLKLAEAWSGVLPLSKSRVALEAIFTAHYEYVYYQTMKQKIGIVCDSELDPSKSPVAQYELQQEQESCEETNQKRAKDENYKRVDKLMESFAQSRVDFTNAFQVFNKMYISPFLNGQETAESLIERTIAYFLNCRPQLAHLKNKIHSQFTEQELSQMVEMSRSNPFILQMMGVTPTVINQEVEKLEEKRRLETITQTDVDLKDSKIFRSWLSEYLDCIQTDFEQFKQRIQNGQTPDQPTNFVDLYVTERKRILGRVNPTFVLRNHIAQRAIEKAEKGDYSEVRKVLQLLQKPFDEVPTDYQDPTDGLDHYGPDWSSNVCVTCSS